MLVMINSQHIYLHVLSVGTVTPSGSGADRQLQSWYWALGPRLVGLRNPEDFTLFPVVVAF